MIKSISVFMAALMVTFSLAAFQTPQANAAGYGQAEQTGAYATGGSVAGPPVGR